MNRIVQSFFHQQPGEAGSGKFSEVIPLHERPDILWEEILALIPQFPRGWYELSHLSARDRVEFTQEYWNNVLPYKPKVSEGIAALFECLDDIGIFITQDSVGSPFKVHLVYSLGDNTGFFQGYPPANEEQIIELHAGIGGHFLPADFLAFLRIHDGFGKYTDTGIIPTSELRESYGKLLGFFENENPIINEKGDFVDPTQLIPFYESFGLRGYQCFYGDWYPEQEMGNVYYSGSTHTLSPIFDKDQWEENLAFPSFIDWLVFYLERIV